MVANGQLSPTCTRDYFFGQVHWSNRRINKHNLHHCFLKVNFTKADSTHPSKLMQMANTYGSRKRRRSSSEKSPVSKRLRRRCVSVQQLQAKFRAKQAEKKRKMIALGFPLNSSDEEDALMKDRVQKLQQQQQQKDAQREISTFDPDRDTPLGSFIEDAYIPEPKSQRVQNWIDRSPAKPEDLEKSDELKETVQPQKSTRFKDKPCSSKTKDKTSPSNSNSSSKSLPIQSKQKTKVVIVKDDSNITKRQSGASSDMISDYTMDSVLTECKSITGHSMTTQELLDISLPSMTSGDLRLMAEDDDAQDGKIS